MIRKRPFRARLFIETNANAPDRNGRQIFRSIGGARENCICENYNDGRSPELATIRSFGYANNSRHEFTPPVFHIYLRRLRDRSLFSYLT